MLVVSVTAGDGVAQEGRRDIDAPIGPDVVPGPSQETWPSETDPILLQGSNKVLLTVQHPLMRAATDKHKTDD